ncbi:YjfB family protein [Aneurinibacillus aneurinilyticus]|nr:YjfB family protein [Aneurinibacillus aneurinilyticus]MED0704646.1 YjfB family protein [Aneurinibacillus aneurinilyticus]MED0726573.1 YjfB family protein [Aneurinibacillus aneurinilyticus]MED0734716.1 YjfB family protein [Aneurinibacillus aneurinilyticus]MED0743304.1 YjfB family protein [Aneurinibacillus aneurinilyticus]
MDIAAMATSLKAASLGTAVSLAVTKKAMDTQKEAGAQLVELLEKSMQPHLGNHINIRA